MADSSTVSFSMSCNEIDRILIVCTLVIESKQLRQGGCYGSVDP
jgi:hypothetical protein